MTVTKKTAAPTINESRLHQLAQAHGVGTKFTGWDGLPYDVDPETLVKVLAALGVPANEFARITTDNFYRLFAKAAAADRVAGKTAAA